METHDLTYPAPRRMSVENGDGTYTTKAWTEQGVKEYRLAGGFFLSGLHDFANAAASRAATGRHDG